MAEHVMAVGPDGFESREIAASVELPVHYGEEPRFGKNAIADDPPDSLATSRI
jgi:hypothetical protein